MKALKESRRRLGLVAGRYRDRLVGWAGVPRDPRGIVLACGFVATAGVGAVALSDGDPIGWGYLALAACGYFFVQTRLMPAFVWLVVAAMGLWGWWSGAPGAWV